MNTDRFRLIFSREELVRHFPTALGRTQVRLYPTLARAYTVNHVLNGTETRLQTIRIPMGVDRDGFVIGVNAGVDADNKINEH